MANHIHELAKEAFDTGNYQLAVELFECILQIGDKMTTTTSTTTAAMSDVRLTIDTYIGYGDSLARCGRIHESFDVFVLVCTQMGYVIPLDRLKQLTIGLLESVSTTITSTAKPSAHASGESKSKFSERQMMASADHSERVVSFDSNRCCSDIDPFVCPVCNDVLVSPVTIACGHTYCRLCIDDRTHCCVCGKALQLYSNKFKADVLIGQLIEKWWTPLLQARHHNDETETFMRQNALDQALKSCNVSLEKSEYNHHHHFQMEIL